MKFIKPHFRISIHPGTESSCQRNVISNSIHPKFTQKSYQHAPWMASIILKHFNSYRNHPKIAQNPSLYFNLKSKYHIPSFYATYMLIVRLCVPFALKNFLKLLYLCEITYETIQKGITCLLQDSMKLLETKFDWTSATYQKKNEATKHTLCTFTSLAKDVHWEWIWPPSCPIFGLTIYQFVRWLDDFLSLLFSQSAWL